MALKNYILVYHGNALKSEVQKKDQEPVKKEPGTCKMLLFLPYRLYASKQLFYPDSLLFILPNDSLPLEVLFNPPALSQPVHSRSMNEKNKSGTMTLYCALNAPARRQTESAVHLLREYRCTERGHNPSRSTTTLQLKYFLSQLSAAA